MSENGHSCMGRFVQYHTETEKINLSTNISVAICQWDTGGSDWSEWASRGAACYPMGSSHVVQENM
jgi:hypothetical protein